MRRARQGIGGLCALFCAAVAWGAAEERLSDEALLAELENGAAEDGFDFELPAWDFSAGAALGAGYRDNVLLAAFAPDSSAFVRAATDFMVWRYLSENGVEWINFVDATATHYFSAATDDALLAMARSEWRWQHNDRWRFEVGGLFVHQNEVIDASTLDSGLTSVEAQLDSFAVEPAVEWRFAPAWSWLAEISARFDDFRFPLDDYFEYEIESGLRHQLEHGGDVRVTYGYVWRDFVDRPQSAVGGRPLFGTELVVGQHKLETRYELRGGENWKWDFDVRVSYMENKDNGSGWYDYDRRIVSASWSCRRDSWSIEADADWRRYDYRVQTVGFGNPPKRERTAWSGYLRAEKRLTENLALYSELEFEHNVSNDPFLDYDDLVIFVGAGWTR